MKKKATIVPVDTSRLEELAQMNYQLNIDEKYDKTRNIDEIKEKLREYLGSGFQAYLFQIGDENCGYALVNEKKTPCMIRHFYIKPEVRLNGLGKRILRQLIQELGKPEVDMEVMAWNRTGRRFLRSCGFKVRKIGWRLSVKPESTLWISDS